MVTKTAVGDNDSNRPKKHWIKNQDGGKADYLVSPIKKKTYADLAKEKEKVKAKKKPGKK